MAGGGSKKFPYEIQDVDPEDNKMLREYLFGYQQDFVLIGPKKYFINKLYSERAEQIYNMPLRSDDVFVVTYPKSGTTMTQELVWLLCNNLDYETAQEKYLIERFPFLEVSTLVSQGQLEIIEDQSVNIKRNLQSATVDDIEEMPSPRFIKSHLPLSLLPPAMLDETKVLYVARDPRDVAVSFYYHHKFTKQIDQDSSFKTFWNYFVKDQMMWSPIFEHILEAWAKRDHPNMLFMFYEDMIKDLPGTIIHVAKFFDVYLSDEQIVRLVHHLLIDNFKKNKSVNFESLQQCGIFSSDGAFIRQGKSGKWRDHFDAEMTAQAEDWIKENLRGTDFCFPE